MKQSLSDGNVCCSFRCDKKRRSKKSKEHKKGDNQVCMISIQNLKENGCLMWKEWIPERLCSFSVVCRPQMSADLMRVSPLTEVTPDLWGSLHPHKQSASGTLWLSHPVKKGRAPDMKWNHITVHPRVSWPLAMTAHVNKCFKVHEHNTQGLQLKKRWGDNARREDETWISNRNGMFHHAWNIN